MSTFYVMPPRLRLGDSVIEFLQRWFPGLSWRNASRAELAEELGSLASRQPNVFVVFQEDLREGMDLAEALEEDFGAVAGDEIIDLTRANPRRWRLAA